jgi:transposase
MRVEERLEQVEKENSELRRQLREAYQKIDELTERLKTLEKHQAKDSHNSSKPPSSDGPGRRRRAQRSKSEKPSGGQTGHRGHTLMQVATPDTIVSHRPAVCAHCQYDLRPISGIVRERRQVHDLPELRLMVQEHQVEEVCCPACQQVTRGCFPAGVEAAAHYGPHVQALAVYLSQFQLVPMERTCEALEDLCHCSIGQGTLMNWLLEAAQRLQPTMEHIKALLISGRAQARR